MCWTSLTACQQYSVFCREGNEFGNLCINAALTNTIPCTTGSANTYTENLYVCVADATTRDGNPAHAASLGLFSPSGLPCYQSAVSCLNATNNPCSVSSPCTQQTAWCNNGYSDSVQDYSTEPLVLAKGKVSEATYTFACPLMIPSNAFPQASDLMCYASQVACEADAHSGCAPGGADTVNATRFNAEQGVWAPGRVPVTTVNRCVSDAFVCGSGEARKAAASWFCPNAYPHKALVTENGGFCYSTQEACAISSANPCTSNTPSTTCMKDTAQSYCTRPGGVTSVVNAVRIYQPYVYYCPVLPSAVVAEMMLASPPPPPPPMRDVSPPPPHAPVFLGFTATIMGEIELVGLTQLDQLNVTACAVAVATACSVPLSWVTITPGRVISKLLLAAEGVSFTYSVTNVPIASVDVAVTQLNALAPLGFSNAGQKLMTAVTPVLWPTWTTDPFAPVSANNAVVMPILIFGLLAYLMVVSLYTTQPALVRIGARRGKMRR